MGGKAKTEQAIIDTLKELNEYEHKKMFAVGGYVDNSDRGGWLARWKGICFTQYGRLPSSCRNGRDYFEIHIPGTYAAWVANERKSI